MLFTPAETRVFPLELCAKRCSHSLRGLLSRSNFSLNDFFSPQQQQTLSESPKLPPSGLLHSSLCARHRIRPRLSAESNMTEKNSELGHFSFGLMASIVPHLCLSIFYVLCILSVSFSCLSSLFLFLTCPSPRHLHLHHLQFAGHGDKVSEKTEPNVRNCIFFLFEALEIMQHPSVFSHVVVKKTISFSLRFSFGPVSAALLAAGAEKTRNLKEKSPLTEKGKDSWHSQNKFLF